MSKISDRAYRMLDAANRKVTNENLENKCKVLAKLYHSRPDQEYPLNWGRHRIHVNMVYPRVRTSMSSVFAKRPEVIVRPRRQGDAEAAKTAELFLNYLTRHLNLARELRMWLMHSRLFHYGCMKITFDKSTGLPKAEAVHPLSVRVDPTTEYFEPDKGIFQAFKYRRTVTNLRQSNLYDDAEINKLVREAKKKDDAFSEDHDIQTIWECYIKEGKKITQITMPEDQKDIVLREKEYTSVAGLPGRFLYFSPSPDTWFPVSPIELWLKQQEEKNLIRSNELTHADRAQRTFGYDKNRMDSEDLPFLESTEPLKFVPTNGSPKEVLQAIEQANLPADIYQVEARIDEDIAMIDGIGGLQVGAREDQPSRSATEASILQTTFQRRASDMQDVWEEALESLYQGLLNLAQAHTTVDMQMRITDSIWVPMTKEDIQGDFDVIMSFGSTMPTDREAEWRKALELVGVLTTNPSFAPLVKADKVLRYLLSKQGDIKDYNEWINPPMPIMPMAGPGAPPPGMDVGAGSPVLQQAQLGEDMLAGATPLQSAADIRQMV